MLVPEGQNAGFTVTLLGTTSRTVTVAFSTSNGTASAPGDYVATIGTLTFNPGDRAKTVNVSVVDDTANEIAEVFHLTLSGPNNATILKSLGTATIPASDQTASPQGGGGTPPTGGTGALSRAWCSGPASVTVGSNGVARMTISCAKASPITCTGNVALETRGKPKFSDRQAQLLREEGEEGRGPDLPLGACAQAAEEQRHAEGAGRRGRQGQQEEEPAILAGHRDPEGLTSAAYVSRGAGGSAEAQACPRAEDHRRPVGGLANERLCVDGHCYRRRLPT